MADYDRTEAPTPRKREEARRRGQVARSAEISSVLILLASFGVLRASGENMFHQLGTLMAKSFQPAAMVSFSDNNLATYASVASSAFLGIISPIILGLTVTGLAVNLAQTRLLFTTQPLKPNLARLNPVSGLQRMFSAGSLFELAKALFKVSVCAFIGYQVLAEKYPHFLMLQHASLFTSVGIIGGVALELGFKIGAVLLAMAALDYFYQRQRFEKGLRMSRTELKEEFRRTEGDPQIKARIKQQQRILARQRMMQSVPKADVIITNPTHLAVALQYDAARMAAPVVVAKGERLIAEQIKKVAMEHGVPIVENKPLAQALFKMVEIGEQIPASLYQAVAEVLAFIYQLKLSGQQRQSWT